jgi:uncharacterized membrane protein
MLLLKKEAITKALFWRFVVAIPLGTLITYIWVGEIWKSISLMLFMNVLFTCLHYLYEMIWPKIWEKIDESN